MRWCGMFLLCVGGTAGIRQRASDEYSLVTAGIQFDDVCLADAVHAGDGVETLSFFDGMQEIRLVLLCHCTQRACADKQQGADNAVNRFHSVIVGLCLQFPKVAAKLVILSYFNQRIALRIILCISKPKNMSFRLIFGRKPLFLHKFIN